MAKLILTGRSAQSSLLRGATSLARAVSPTFGPIGRTVIMRHRGQGPDLTSDGFTICRRFELFDPFEDMAVRFLEEAAEQVREACGDGTTTTILLAEALVRLAQPSLAMGADPMALARGMRIGMEKVVAALHDAASPVKDTAQLTSIASVAAKDQGVGSAVANMVDQVGADGAVIAIQSEGRDLECEIIEGFHFDHGALSPHFITDRTRMVAALEDPYVLLTGKTLERVDDILPALQRILPTARTLLILAKDVKGEALTGLAMNKERGHLDVLAVKAPDSGGRQEDRLADLSAALGGTVIPDEETGRTLSSIQLHDLGRASRVTSDRYETTIVGGWGDKKEIDHRTALIRSQIEEAQTDQYVRYLQKRLGALQGKTAFLRVGGLTESEVKVRLSRVRNAVAACREALRSGWLPGAGAAFVRAASALETSRLERDELTGARILQQALTSPLLTIAHNSGLEPIVTLSRLVDAEEETTLDATTGELVSALGTGILDPAGTLETTALSAVSVAAAMLTIDAAVAIPPGSAARLRPDMSAKYE